MKNFVMYFNTIAKQNLHLTRIKKKNSVEKFSSNKTLFSGPFFSSKTIYYVPHFACDACLLGHEKCCLFLELIVSLKIAILIS